MNSARRTFLVGSGAAAAATATSCDASAQTRATGSGRAAADGTRELRGVLDQAGSLGLDTPRAAGPSSPIELALLIDAALARRDDEAAASLASRAGLLLSEITRDAKDGIAVELPAQAAPRQLTEDLRREYRALFASAQIRQTALAELTRVARFIERARERYREVEARTRVPWYLIGALHYREASLNFMGHLHNGDPLLLRTVHVPERRPPAPWPKPDLSPKELWRESAVDALSRFAQVTTWTLPDMCYLMERYNGFGCRDRGINSPYLWSYTQHYTSGGFPRDHEYRSDYRSKQAGLMSVLVALRQIAPDDIKLDG